ncbi:MAG: VWA domain-containing protein [Nitrospira sp.]|jgi:nitric oxide reductase NorD protein|nr:VWA domain-containing protein [Nitrospira sp.]
MAASQAETVLAARLAEELGSAPAAQLVARLALMGGKPDPVAATLAMLDELGGVSEKVARAAIEALPELDRRAGLASIVAWFDLGIALAESSGATALKYFKDSPRILGIVEAEAARQAILATGLEFAEQDANVTLEYLRTAPQILAVLPSDQLQPWLDVGVELTQIDVVVGLEYIRQIAAVAPVLGLGEIRNWVAFGMKLIQPNTIGKPDYLGTMEFLRTSPAILGDIEQPPVRSKVVSLGAALAEQSPASAIAWLAESPKLLRPLPSVEWQVKVVQYGGLLAEKDAETALSYLRRAPEIIGMIGVSADAVTRFENWFKAGMEVLAYSVEGARAYFGLESQQSLASVEQALSGVPLRQVARTVKLFVQGLCGTDVMIQALPDSAATGSARATVSADGRTISLPALLRRYPTYDENVRLYLVMAAHEAGHLEFGTYRLTLAPLHDVVRAVCQRYGRGDRQPASLAALFRLYPHPRLMQDLWMVLEDARVEAHLQREYPGLQRDLQRLAGEAVTPRDPAHGLTVKELIVDCLLRLSTGESAASAVPRAVQAEVALLWELSQPAFAPAATAEDVVRLADAVYLRMEELLAPKAEMIQADQVVEETNEAGVGPTGSEQSGDDYRPITNWVYRGEMNPEFITRDPEQAREEAEPQSEVEQLASGGGGSKEQGGGAQGSGGQRHDTMGDVLGGGRALPAVVEEMLALPVEERLTDEPAGDGVRQIRYPEWDVAIQDYRPHWCRVVERVAEPGSDESVAATLTAHRSAIKTLRRFFESLRPPAFRRTAAQADGEDLDIDAVVRRVAEQQAGMEGSDRIYVRHEKKERDVAVAFLVDVSGSTSRQLENGRRVIDIEKESLVLLCEALEAVGDQYALFAYSGQGRGQVECAVVKDFDERVGPATAQRLGGLLPRQQNRDGAVIRHATARLRAREARTKLLVLISDGRPLDGDYKDDYSLEDTKAALREARQAGIGPFCVTIDRDADAYLRRMYGDVQFAVIDRVEALPAKLPRIYQRLTA